MTWNRIKIAVTIEVDLFKFGKGVVVVLEISLKGATSRYFELFLPSTKLPLN